MEMPIPIIRVFITSLESKIINSLGVVHNCQHLCISTESTRVGRGVRGQRTIFLNVDQFVEHIIKINATGS